MDKELKKAWQNQFLEGSKMTTEDFRRRASEWRQESRRGLLASSGIVCVLLAMTWRFNFLSPPWYDVGFAVAAAWAVGSAIWFRQRLWPVLWPGLPREDPLSASGLHFYRQEILQRRAHLKATWAWGGPAFLALGLFGVRLVKQAFDTDIPLQTLAPFLGLCLIWCGMMAFQTTSKLRQLDDELRRLETNDA